MDKIKTLIEENKENYAVQACCTYHGAYEIVVSKTYPDDGYGPFVIIDHKDGLCLNREQMKSLIDVFQNVLDGKPPREWVTRVMLREERHHQWSGSE